MLIDVPEDVLRRAIAALHNAGYLRAVNVNPHQLEDPITQEWHDADTLVQAMRAACEVSRARALR